MEISMMIWVLIAGVLALAVRRFLLRPNLGSHNLPPGTVGWPFLGEVLSFYLRPREFIAERRNRYGSLFRTSLLGYPTVISTDPDANRFILQNDGRLFVPQYPSSFEQLIGKWTLFAARGDSHKRRRGAVLHFISASILKHRLLSEIQNIITSNLSGWEGRTVNVAREAEEMIFSLLANHMLSLQKGTQLDKMKRDFYVLKDGFLTVPWNIPGTAFHKSLQKRKEVGNQIKNIIEERNKNLDSYDDLLSSILREAAETGGGKLEITTDQIADLVVGLFMAATDTTKRTMARAVMCLSENPHVILELMEEYEAIKRTKGNDESLSWEDYKSMVLTRNVIKETLRTGEEHVNPILFRKTIQNVQLGGYTIPKGWTCLVYAGFSNLDSKFYPDPLAFNPRRWQDKNVNQAPFLAFGGGPRICPGSELATLFISFFLYHLMTKVKWEYIPSNSKPRWFDSTFTLKMDCTIRVEKL